MKEVTMPVNVDAMIRPTATSNTLSRRAKSLKMASWVRSVEVTRVWVRSRSGDSESVCSFSVSEYTAGIVSSCVWGFSLIWGGVFGIDWDALYTLLLLR